MNGMLKLFGLLSLAFVLLAPPALADEKEDEAFKLYQAAREDFERRDFAAAAEKLERAYELFPKGVILFKLGEAQEALGLIEEAHKSYVAVETDNRDMEKRVRSAVRRVEGLLAKPVKLSVLSGAVTGARIFVDDADTGAVTPAVIEVSRGTHVIRVAKDGYQDFTKEGVVAKGIDTITVAATLKPLLGQVQIRMREGTFQNVSVQIDGKNVAISDPTSAVTESISVPMGRHDLVCSRPGSPRHYGVFRVNANEELTVTCELEAAPTGGSSALAWTTLSAGVVAAGLGTYFLISYFDDVDFAESTNQRLESNKQIFGPVLIGVGVAAGVTSIFLFPSEPEGETSGSVDVSVRPTLAPLPEGGMIGASGRF